MSQRWGRKGGRRKECRGATGRIGYLTAIAVLSKRSIRRASRAQEGQLAKGLRSVSRLEPALERRVGDAFQGGCEELLEFFGLRVCGVV